MYNDTLNGGMFNGRDMEELPEAVGPVAQLQEKLYVPVKEYPDVSGQISDLWPFCLLFTVVALSLLSAERMPENQRGSWSQGHFDLDFI